MSLGLARDSLANLLSLVHNDDTEDDLKFSRSAGHSSEELPKLNDEDPVTNGENGEEFFFFDDEENDVPTSIPVVVVQPAIPITRKDSDATTTLTSNKQISPPKTTANEETKKEETKLYQHKYKKLSYAGLYDYGYSNCEFSAHGDYYSDSYAVTPYPGILNNVNVSTGIEKRDIFCCFFPGGYDSDDSRSSSYAVEDVACPPNAASSSLNDALDTSSKVVPVAATPETKVDIVISSTLGSDSGVLNTASSQIIDDDANDVCRPKLLIENIDDFGDAAKLKLPPPNPKVLENQRTDSFSTAQSIPSTWSKCNSQQNGDNTSLNSVAGAVNTAAPKDSKSKTSIVKKRIPITDAVPLKGILKKTDEVRLNMSTDDVKGIGKENSLTMRSNVGNPSRRNIFPTYHPRPSVSSSASASGITGYDTCSVEKPPKKNVTFQPMSRVVTVKARTSMSFMDKCQIWWQKPDYDDFKKAARIIAKAMVEGGSEIWLQTSESWGRQKHSQQKRGGTHQNATSIKSPAYQRALKKYGVVIDDSDDDSTGSGDDAVCSGDKWWCKFGHSRRGLEHIVSPNEGRQRHKYVTDATRAVLEEQRRQRVSSKDPGKIASISLTHTSWARELAFAAGAADDEAVRSKFCTNAKSRISHLHENLRMREKRKEKGSGASVYRSAHFILSANPALTSLILDENTHPSMTHRAKNNGSASTRHTSKKAVFSSHQMRKLDEYHDANHGENKEADIMKSASGFGSISHSLELMTC